MSITVERSVKTFDTTWENILEDHLGLEEEINLKGDKECYKAYDESFSDSEVDLETKGNENENQRAQRLIWRDG